MEYIAGILPGESPIDKSSPTVNLTIPGVRFSRQSSEIGKPSFPEALAREQPDLDFSLIEPAAVLWSVMDGEAIPQLRPFFQTEVVYQRLPGVNIEVVQN